MKYRIGFVEICVEEINSFISAKIRYNAIAHRASKLDTQEFESFVSGDTKEKVIDHEAQMRKAKNGF